MSTTAPEGPRTAPSALVLVLVPVLAPVLALVLGLALTGCSDDPAYDGGDGAPAASAGAEPGTVPVPPDLLQDLRGLLDRRASALLARDPVPFRAGLAKGDPGFVAEQEGYFAGLTQLPISTLAYSVDRGSLLRDGDDYWVAVDVILQLDPYDALPVTTRDRYRFSPSRRDPGHYLLSSVTDAQWEAAHDVQPQPWDLGPIEVRQAPGVLGIFDAGSLAAADQLMASTSRGVADVSGVVPYAWSGAVVLYALSDPEFLGTIDDLPGGDPETLDGVSFPVPVAAGSAEVASTRFVLNPRMLDRAGSERDRLVRHELTHVALGTRDDLAPVWLSEGLAEYVSVRPLAPEDRQVNRAAIEAAEAGVDGLPAGDTFNDADSAAHYGLAWWVCEYVAATYGEQMLWTLLDYVATPGADPSKRIQMALGLNARQLARAGARLLVATFDPEFLEPTPAPSPTSTTGPGGAATPSASPSSTP